ISGTVAAVGATVTEAAGFCRADELRVVVARVSHLSTLRPSIQFRDPLKNHRPNLHGLGAQLHGILFGEHLGRLLVENMREREPAFPLRAIAGLPRDGLPGLSSSAAGSVRYLRRVRVDYVLAISLKDDLGEDLQTLPVGLGHVSHGFVPPERLARATEG